MLRALILPASGGGGGGLTWYTSAWQSITGGGTLVLAHGLGAVPSIVIAELQCVAGGGADGYANGDVIPINPAHSGGGAGNFGHSLVPDATNVNVTIGTGLYRIINPSSGLYVTISAANYEFRVRAAL